MTRTTMGRAGASARVMAAVVLVAAVAAVAGAASADAAAYRYWTYWQAPAGATAWAFATQGPGTSVPADGSVEGWSFGVTTQSANPEDAPSIAPDFPAICGSTPVQADRKRIALVIDAGPRAAAPPGQVPPAPVTSCVVADPQATGYDVLRSVADVRTEGGLVCGIAGYPAGECAPVLDDAEAASVMSQAAQEAPVASPLPSVTGLPAGPDGGTGLTGSGSPLATVVVAALLIGAAGLTMRRARRSR